MILWKKNKATGADGIPIEFYQTCWHIMKTDILKVFTDFYHHKINHARINYGIITLIPKGDDANVIQKFRPICLLQVLFKIFTKALTVRSELVMQKTIQKCQNAFIKGRFIHDGVSLLHEILRETRVSPQQGVVLKIAFEKAYVKVQLEFSPCLLQTNGF